MVQSLNIFGNYSMIILKIFQQKKSIPTYPTYYVTRSLNIQIEGCEQDISNSNIFLKLLFRGTFDPFVNNANLGDIAHATIGTYISIVYRKKCYNLHNDSMLRRLSIGKNNHLACYSLAINPRNVFYLA